MHAWHAVPSCKWNKIKNNSKRGKFFISSFGVSFYLFPKRQTRIEISYIPRDLITVIFYYQISLNPLKTQSLSQVSFPLVFPLRYIVPPVFTNSDKGKNKGAGHSVDVRFASTVAKRRPRKLYKTV